MKLQLILLDDLFYRGTGPRGNTGPAGPTGPTGPESVSIYGSRYDATENTIAATANTSTVIPLTTIGETMGITSETENALTINENGIYKIDYLFQGSSNVQGDLTLEVMNNNNQIKGSTITKEVTANNDATLVGSVITPLNAGDKITLSIESSVTATLTPTSGTSVYLNIVKL